MIYLFSILYLSWALWIRDCALYEFDFDIRLSPKGTKGMVAKLISAKYRVESKTYREWIELSEPKYYEL